MEVTMLFTKLKLNNFGRFHNREIDLLPGINLIYGENEAGKSTIHTFIKGMLFGIERLRGRGSASKDDVYTHYLPWDYPGAFNGNMDILVGDKKYRLQRNFHANDKNFTILDLSTGREVKLKEGHIGEIIPGLTESSYKNTISIEQLKAQTDTELAAQVRNYITNLSITKSKEINVAKAVSYLTEQKKLLEAAQSTTVWKDLLDEIEEGVAREEKIDSLSVQLRNSLIEEQELNRQKEAASSLEDSEEARRIEQLPAILEKYHNFKELTKQSLQLEQQCAELEEKVAAWEAKKQPTDTLKEEVKAAERLNAEIQEYEKRQAELLKERGNTLLTIKNRNLMLSMLPTFGIFLLSLVLAKSLTMWVAISACAVLAGGITYVILKQTEKKEQKLFQVKINDIQQQIFASNAQIANILNKNQASTIEELPRKQEEVLKHYYTFEHNKELLIDLEKRKSDLDDNLDLIYDAIMKYIQHFVPVEELAETSMQMVQEEIRLRKSQLQQKYAEINQRYDSCKLRIEKLRWEISSLNGNEIQLLKNKENYARLEQKHKERGVELEAVKLALNTIQALSIDIHDSFGRQLNTKVSEIIGEVTNQKYTDIKVNEKLEVKVGWNGDYILLDKLSAGTMDQIYFALRLVVADLLLGKEEVPLLLDDTFALYDENRVKAALMQIKDRKQIILFSCHKREKRLLEELQLPYHFVDLSCR